MRWLSHQAVVAEQVVAVAMTGKARAAVLLWGNLDKTVRQVKPKEVLRVRCWLQSTLMVIIQFLQRKF